jgi:hypothetical protein
MARIELVIEELVLHGFDPADGASISAAVQAELSRLLADGGLPDLTHPLDLTRLNAGAFALPPSPAPPSQVGAQIAGAIHTGLKGVSDG